MKNVDLFKCCQYSISFQAGTIIIKDIGPFEFFNNSSICRPVPSMISGIYGGLASNEPSEA